MALETGRQLGVYEILGALGAGGMGEVYRARDTKLGRNVAIKVLPDELLDEEERRSRFEREAKLLAALNHPNIATLHGLEEIDGRQFLVMELVDGETLAERIARGQIPWDEARSIFIQIADGLEAAHAKGILHRDLKPANIKLTAEGTVKILDFGLAKLAESDTERLGVSASQSPTLTKGTALGAILGTASYMSPQQAKGKATDARTDVWAFGCVLFEALTGRRAFEGDDVSEILASVLRDEPAWAAIPSVVPAGAVDAARRCLRKEVRGRTQHVGDVRIALEEVDRLFDQAEPMEAQTPRWLFAALAIAAAFAAWGWLRPPPELPLQGVTRSEILIEYPIRLGTNRRSLAISPDGARIGLVVDNGGVTQIYVRELSELDGRLVLGTEGATDVFFSPDGRSIGYRDADAYVTTLSLGGGVPERWQRVGPSRGGTWPSDDVVVLTASTNSGLGLVTPSGRQPLTQVDNEKGELSHRWPHTLSGRDDAVTFTVSRAGGFDTRLLLLETGETRALIEGASDARQTASGHLVFGRDNALFAVGLDSRTHEPVGSVTRMIEGVASQSNGVFHYAISDTGRLVYIEGPETSGASSIGWVSEEGSFEPIFEHSGPILDVSIAPDGRLIAMSLSEVGNTDIWTYDLARDTPTRLTFDPGEDFNPVWSPDGEWIVFASEMRGEPPSLHRMRAQGDGTADWLSPKGNPAAPSDAEIPTSWSIDGARVLYRHSHNIYEIAVDGEGERSPIVATAFLEHGARVSPDGRWLAFHSEESGRAEVYIQPYPGPGAKQQVSNEGGTWPAWGASGRTIFYRNGDRMMAVTLQTEQEIELSRPQLLFTERYSVGIGHSSYDIANDGRFLMIRDEVPPSTNRIVLVTHWLEELPQE